MDRQLIIEQARIKYKDETKNITHALKLFLKNNNAQIKEVTIFISKKASQTQNTTKTRPCTNKECAGTQTLSHICPSCAEAKAGYKTKWTCGTCNRRDLEKEAITP